MTSPQSPRGWTAGKPRTGIVDTFPADDSAGIARGTAAVRLQRNYRPLLLLLVFLAVAAALAAPRIRSRWYFDSTSREATHLAPIDPPPSR